MRRRSSVAYFCLKSASDERVHSASVLKNVPCVSSSGTRLGIHKLYQPRNHGSTKGMFSFQDSQTRCSSHGPRTKRYVAVSPRAHTGKSGTLVTMANLTKPKRFSRKKRLSSQHSANTSSGTPPGTTINGYPASNALRMASQVAGMHPISRANHPKTGT